MLDELVSDAGGCYLGSVPDEAHMVSTAANNYASATWPISNYLEAEDTGKDYRPGDLMTKHFGLGCDVSGDCFVDTNDAVLALQTAAEMEIFVDVYTEADADDDGEIGLAEGIYALKLISGGS